MALNWEGEQAKADAEPRMRELVSWKVRCERCRELTDEFVQHYGTGEFVCMDCYEYFDGVEEEESDE